MISYADVASQSEFQSFYCRKNEYLNIKQLVKQLLNNTLIKYPPLGNCQIQYDSKYVMYIPNTVILYT